MSTAAAGAPDGGQPPAGAPPARGRRLDPEFFVTAFLAGLGALVLIEASEIAPDLANRGPVGPRAIPVAIGVSLLVLAVFHGIDVARGHHGEAEGGEDIDAHGAADWRTMAILVAGFVANILLIETLGWPLSGALLFYVVAFSLGARNPLRDIAIALALGFISFYIFSNLLGIPLPEGPLEAVL
jgi:putative tricarboxylic transport membrane protein